VTVSVRDLSVRYGARSALRDITFAAEPGQGTVVIGQNGSGKSSLVKAIAGLAPHSGSVRLGTGGGKPPRIGYMPQDHGIRAALTVLETVLLGRLGRLGLKVAAADLAAAIVVLHDVGLAALAQRDLGALSGGQRQLVFLAQALASDPEILLLDEPISALDIRHQLEVLTLVRAVTKARGLTTLCVLHDLHAASRYADRLVVLRAGTLMADGPPAEVLTPETLAEAYDVEADIQTDRHGGQMVIPLRSLASGSRV